MLILFMAPMMLFSAEAGSNGMAFLKIDVDGRAAAMGGAYTALASDAAAAYWNPAGLASASSRNLVLMHNVWLANISQEFASLQINSAQHYLALSANLMIIPGIEIRSEVPTEQPDGITNALNFYTGLSYACNFAGNWQAGITFKYLFERYYLAQANGWAIDLGVRRLQLLKNVDWGLTVQNLGQMAVLEEVNTPLPLMARSGLVYHLPFSFFQGGHVLTADVQYIKDEQIYVRAGSAWNIHQYLTLLGGLAWYNHALHFSTGMSLHFNTFHLDYAFIPFADNLGNSHRFSFGFSF